MVIEFLYWNRYMLIYVVQKLNNLPSDTECYRIYSWFKITTSVSSWWRHGRNDFHITGPFVKGITGQQPSDVDFPHKSIVTWSFGVFFGVELNKLFNKRLMWRWFDTTWRPCDAAVVWKTFFNCWRIILLLPWTTAPICYPIIIFSIWNFVDVNLRVIICFTG